MTSKRIPHNACQYCSLIPSIFSFIADMMLPDGSQNQEWDWNIFLLERQFPAPKVESKVGDSFTAEAPISPAFNDGFGSLEGRHWLR
jgi:hypothetical protein